MRREMVLLGTEVKSLREGKANLRDSYAVIRAGAVWLLNCHIAEYLPGGPYNHTPLRPRKLLLKKEEIEKLDRKSDQKGADPGASPDLLPGRHRQVRNCPGPGQEKMGRRPDGEGQRGQEGSRRGHV